MNFISYSQNFEDVMLWRALKNVKNGLYIDVGANDPIEYSVTKAFYDSGWTGINIEPMKQYYDALCKQRPLDINLSFAISDEVGELQLYEIKDTGLSTLNKNVAEMHRNNGCKIEQHSIKVVRLNDICKKYIRSEINFLKIDVEGFETQVLKGMDFRKYRPWIIIVETTEPSTGKIEDLDGEKLLIKNGYKKVYFDGINSFYVAKEQLNQLEGYFNCPPNVFDRYERNSEKILHDTIKKLENDKLCMKQIINDKDNIINEKNNIITGICNSLSWKITKPLRFIKRFFKKIFTF